MKIFKTVLLIIIVFFIQIAIAPNIQIGSSFPNLMLILIVFLLLEFNYSEALICAGIGGIMMDLYSPMYFGIYTVGYLMVYFIAYFIYNKFFSEQVFFTIFLSFFVGYLIIEIIPILVYHGSYIAYFYSAIYTTILGMSIYYIFSGKFKKTESAYSISDKL